MKKPFNYIVKGLLILVAVSTMTSCATMFSGTTYNAYVSATKPDSEIYIDGKLKGVDNVKVKHTRKKDMEIEVKNSGATTDFTVYRAVKWGSQAANLLNWVYFIPVGTIVDAATGGIWQPEHKHVEEVTKLDYKNFNIVIYNKTD